MKTLTTLKRSILIVQFMALDCLNLNKQKHMRPIILVIVILLLLGTYPGWGYNSGWGYTPFGGAGLVVLILVILLCLGKI